VAAAVATVAVLVTVVAGVVAATGGSESPTRVAIGTRDEGSSTPDGWTRRNLGDGTSIAVPPDWQPVSDQSPTNPQLLGAVGTTEPAVTGTLTACVIGGATPTVSGTWLSIYEYPDAQPASTLPDPTGTGEYYPSAFTERRATFELPSAGGFTGQCDATTPDTVTPEAPTNAFVIFPFSENGRLFLARIVTTANPNGDGLARGVEILNTFRLAPDATATTAPSTTTLTPTTTTTPTATTPGASDNEAQIRAVYLAWIDAQPKDAIDAYVEDAASIADAHRQGIAQHTPAELANYAGRVDTVTLTDDTHADVTYSILYAGQVQFNQLPGHAVKIDAKWYVTRETVCDLLTHGGITCPPRQTPVP